jgi:hypothetical protein
LTVLTQIDATVYLLALMTLAMMLSSLALLLERTCFGMSRQMTLILGGAAGLSVNSTALVTGVLTTTAATVHTGGITMPDNAKAIFGAGSDLEIYHDGSNSYVSEVGTGDLRLGAANIRIGDNISGASYIYATQNAEVTLYHNNSPKIATTATGIDVTGAAAFTGGISIDGQNASTPGLSEKSDLDTGIFWPAA